MSNLPPLDEVMSRARAYIEKVPPAIANQGGDDQTFKAACVLIRDFGLPFDAAMVVFREWNQGCAPPWSDRELAEKLKSAQKNGSKPIGALLNSCNYDLTPTQRSARNHKGKTKPDDTQNSSADAWRRIWDETIASVCEEASAVRLYCENRGLNASVSKDVRFHPMLGYWEEASKGDWHTTGEFPALVALIRDVCGNPTGIHRIYLTQDGMKAPVSEPKKAWGKITGGSIRLGPEPETNLHVAEGLETALAIYQATGQSTWCTVNANGMEKLELPDGLKVLNIWADKDRSGTGEDAATELAKRTHAKGITVYVSVPRGPIADGAKGIDWLDVFNEEGPCALVSEMERGEPWSPPTPTQRFVIHWAEEALKPQPPIDWIVDPLFSAGSVNLFLGEGGSKKTWSAIDACVCVAGGTPWLGFKTRRTNVLIIDEESGERRITRRIGDVMRGHSAPSTLPLAYVSLAGMDLRSDRAGAEELLSLIRQTGAGFVVIDALVDVMLGGDENSVKDVQPVFRNLRGIAEISQAAFLVIHHLNKDGKYRGSSAMKGAVDLMLTVDSPTATTTINFSTDEKTRDAMILPFAATAHFGLGEFYLTDAEPVKKAKRMSNSKEYVIRYLQQGDAFMDDIEDHADCCSSDAARQAVYDLARENIVERKNPGQRGVRALYGLKPQPV